MKLSSGIAFSRRRGFSLIELMVATAIGSMVLAAVASLTLFGTRSSVALANYNELDARSRYALDVISRELRQANAVLDVETRPPQKSITLTNAYEQTRICLTWDAPNRRLVLERTGQPPLIALLECDRWDFALYQRTPWVTPTNILYFPATNAAGRLDPSLCKLISMSWRCSRQILQQKVNTESVQAAQIVLRNKP